MATPAAPVIVNQNVESDSDAIEDIITHVPEAVQETRKGYKTTEFWIVLAISVLTVLNGIPLPEKYEGIVVAALGAVYALSRGLAKQGIPDIVVAHDEQGPTA
jgi:hypothetical protein